MPMTPSPKALRSGTFGLELILDEQTLIYQLGAFTAWSGIIKETNSRFVFELLSRHSSLNGGFFSLLILEFSPTIVIVTEKQ